MRTPRAQPSSLALMKSSKLPWNQVAIMRPSACQTVRKRSHSRASRHRAQFSTSSRIVALSAAMSVMTCSIRCGVTASDAKHSMSVTRHEMLRR